MEKTLLLRHSASRHAVSRQRGLTLIEFMVAIVLGMIMVAAIATLIANQSTNRAEIDRSGKMIENGRYALQTISQDVEMAGYWGELTTTPSSPSTLSNPCATAVAGAGNLDEAMGLHVQGYNSPATPPGCLANVKSGTDILVVRHADPDTSDVESGGVVDWAKLQAGQVYLQTGIDTATNAFGSKLRVADGATDSANFTLKRRDKVTVASPRKYLVHIYYIATCSVCTGGSADTIPTLKRVELGVSAGTTAMSSTPVTIAEGIENLQVDYGNDTDGDGAADGVDQDSSACNVIAANAACTGAPLPSYTPVDWGNVMTVKIHLLARNTETTPGYSDTKSYAMGTASAAATSDAYRRHVFVQSVRVVNPSSRRAN